jgi:type VI secretion system protein ImpK
MNPEQHEQSGIAEIDIDLILQTTYLLVFELRQGFGMSDGTLRQKCIAQVDDARSALQAGGMSARNIELISHAQCALLDETVLAVAKDALRQTWINEPLQARFHGDYRAGETLFEEMREVLREPAPDLSVLIVYKRVMMFQFLGGFRALDDDERMRLMNEVNARVPPQEELSTVICGSEPSVRYWWWLRNPVLHVVVAGLALAGTWLFLDRLLARQIAELAQAGL